MSAPKPSKTHIGNHALKPETLRQGCVARDLVKSCVHQSRSLLRAHGLQMSTKPTTSALQHFRQLSEALLLGKVPLLPRADNRMQALLVL